MSKDAALSASLRESAREMNELADAIDDGLLTRVRDSFAGHPRSPSFDAGQATTAPPPDLDVPEDLRGKDTHTDPTGSAAVQAAMFGNKGLQDARALAHDINLIRSTTRHASDLRGRYSARRANVVEAAADEEPGCMSCARVTGHGGKPWWNPATRTTTLASGAKVALCGWCYETPSIGARWSGQLPHVEDVAHYRDNGRARKRSA